jgi:uncharacterized protein (DUF58 family)
MALADVNLPAAGAYADLSTLIAMRFPAQQLKLSKRRRALSVLAGPNKTNFRGRGIDFEEVRSYQSGDDIRTIDWRVTARTGDAHTKLFREERERPVLIVVDQRSSMFFGSRHCFKSVLAAHLAALLGWAALNNGDRVGGLIYNDSDHRELRPRRSRKNVLALLSELERYNQLLPGQHNTHDESFEAMLNNLRRVARPGSSLYLISDFRGASSERSREHMFELAKHTEITAVACSDTLESELPRAGSYTVTDGDKRSELQTGDRNARTRYALEFSEHRYNLTQQFGRLGIPLIEAATHQPPFQVLQTYYGEKRR